MFRCLFAAAAVVLAASSQPAPAQSRVAVGVLECRAGPSTTFIVGSIRDFDCIFTPTDGPLQQHLLQMTAHLRQRPLDSAAGGKAPGEGRGIHGQPRIMSRGGGSPANCALRSDRARLPL